MAIFWRRSSTERYPRPAGSAASKQRSIETGGTHQRRWKSRKAAKKTPKPRTAQAATATYQRYCKARNMTRDAKRSPASTRGRMAAVRTTLPRSKVATAAPWISEPERISRPLMLIAARDAGVVNRSFPISLDWPTITIFPKSVAVSDDEESNVSAEMTRVGADGWK